MRWIIWTAPVVCLVTFLAVQNIVAASLVAVTALFLGAVVLSRRRLAPLVFSPVALVSIGLYAMSLLGALLYGSVDEAVAGGGATVVLSNADTFRTFLLMTLAAFSVLFSGLITAYFMPKIAFTRPKFKVNLPDKAYIWILLGTIAPLAILVVSGGSDILSRPYYISEAVQDGGIEGLAGQLAVAAIIALGYLCAASRGSTRVTSAIIMLGYVAVLFGSGSRRLAMIPILFMVGVFIVRRTRVRGLLLALSGVLSIYLIRLPLFLRALPAHGIIPYLQEMPGFLSYGVGWDSIGRNLLISFGITGQTAFQQPSIGANVFWVSVNPMTGSAAGWYAVADQLRINIYTPYSAIGELGNYGVAYVIGYCLIAGVVLALGDRVVMRFFARGHDVLSLVAVGLAGLFYLYSIQYNLRSATRMLYYGIAACIIWELISRRMVAKIGPVTLKHSGTLATRLAPGSRPGASETARHSSAHLGPMR